jgi:glycosyltransferase involved in cell wall biosynthesis
VTSATPLPGPPLRIAVLGDFDGHHTRRWLRVFVERGHELHAISYYRPQAPLPGVELHVLSDRDAPSVTSEEGRRVRRGRSLGQRLPRDVLRIVNALRYRRAGLRETLGAIGPDVLHAHYAVEHGFFGAFAGFHPYVVSAWGSDIFVETQRLPGRAVARYALHRADLVTANDPAMIGRIRELGIDAAKLALIRLGADEAFLSAPGTSVNERLDQAGPPTVISDRALEPLYNIDIVLRAFALLRHRLPEARLVVAGDGSRRKALEALTARLQIDDAVRFTGHVDRETLRQLLLDAQVYVSVPDSDSLASSTAEAMACGAFPIVSDVASQDGWITDRVNGRRVPAGSVEALADALYESLADHDLRRAAVAPNREKVASEGVLERNMLVMERHYYRLAGHALADERSI